MVKLSGLRERSGSRSVINSKGSILIVALWAITLLSVFAVILGSQARYRMMLVKRLDERTNLRSLAEAGVRLAIAEVKLESEKSFHTMADMWSNNPQVFKDVNTGLGTFTVRYDYSYDRSKGSEPRYGVIDEERKVNINKADGAVLTRLFMLVLGADEDRARELAASVIDWRDSDDELSSPIGSAESPYYRSLSYPYDAKNSEFEVPDELLLVRGFDRDILEKIKDYITVYGSGRINVNTASKEALIAAGLNETIANAIMSFRMGKDKVIGTADDGIFEASSDIVPKLSQSVNLSPSDIAEISAVAEKYLAVNSTAFEIRSIATSKNRKSSFTTTAVVDKKGKVLYWQES